MRLVLDTNVFVGALISKGTLPDKLYGAWRDHVYTLVTSREQMAELDRVLRYERLSRFLSADEARQLINLLDSSAIIVSNLPTINDSPDPDDNLILATAVAGNCDLIVSGDKQHMLSLGAVRGIPIVSPRDAISRLALG